MEVENMSSCINKDEEDEAPLPGFRFHPTDQELVGFYLRRKVDKKPIRLDLIKLLDIYKYDPWDLPKCNSSSSSSREKEWYFFCRRGRKYKNSVRPNRVTGSGFWKATGIDKPIYSDHRQCIGLKKSLVYYRGSAGKGTKTDWMMHEFRLPTPLDKHLPTNTIPLEEAAPEVWTLCRILKRNLSRNKILPEWREMKASNIDNNNPAIDASSETSNGRSSSSYISFRAPVMEKKPVVECDYEFLSSSHVPSSNPIQSYMYGDINEFLRHGDWEDLRSVVDYTAANPLYY